MKIRLYQIAFFMLLLARTAFGTTYYVAATGGNDGNSCSAAQSVSTPKLSITAGIACMSGGDTLNVRAGTYHESSYLNIPSGISDTQRTTIQNYPGESPTMNGSLTLALQNNITWSGVNIDDAGDSGDTTDCVLINSGSNITVTQADIKNCQRHGVLTGDGNGANLSNLMFSYLTVHNTGQGYLTSGDPRHHNFYIAAHNFTTGPIVIDHVESYNTGNPANNDVNAKGSWGIQIYSADPGFLNGVVASNNYVHDNNQGIVVGSGPNHKVYNNIVANNSGVNGEAGITVGYGTSIDNIQIYNNTIVGNANSTYAISVGTFGAPTNTLIKNNIMYQNGIDSVNLAAGSGTAQSNNYTSNPSFVGSTDYHLQASSAARGTGVNLCSTFCTDKDGNARPATGAWDPGPYILATAPGPPPPSVPSAPQNLHLLP